MKKYIAIILSTLCIAASAKADSIVVIDQNGTVTRQIITMPTTIDTTPAVVTTPVTVVRESPVTYNSYYYDSSATNAAIAAGVTTAVVGGVLFHGFHGGHHRPAPPHGRPHGGFAPRPPHRR